MSVPQPEPAADVLARFLRERKAGVYARETLRTLEEALLRLDDAGLARLKSGARS